MANSTQYGLKNKLSFLSVEKLLDQLYELKLKHDNEKIIYLFVHFLSDDIVRFHYSFDKNYKLRINPHLDFEVFTDTNLKPILKQDHLEASKLSFETQKLKIEIAEPLSIKIFDETGQLVCEDEAELGFWSEALESPGTEIRSYKKFWDLENPPLIYGLGDKTGEINRWGRRFRNAPIDALGYDSKNTDPLYKDIPFFINLEKKSQKAHGIFFDNFHPKFFDFGKERKPSPYYYFGAEGGELNYYFFAGPKISDIVSNYLKLTGRPPKWPSYSYGYLSSGMSYTEKDNSQEELLKTFERFENHEVNTSAFHMSSGYTLDDKNQRQQFIWNKNKFPDTSSFVEKLKDKGIGLCVNLKPVLLTSHPWYPEAKQKNLFIENPDDIALEVDYWSGKGSYMDFRKAKTQAWWKQKIKEEILIHRIEGIWNDNNEYEIFEPHQAQGHTHEMALLMTKLSMEACKELNIKEPWILSRSGYSGIQKYAQTWTGDNYSSWQALQYDNAIVASCGLSGLIHCGVDIGGFWGPDLEPELFLRWIQNGVFTPRFCIHSYKDKPTEPDMFKDSHPEFFKIIQKFIALRYELISYIEKQAAKASESGVPIMRPTLYDFQDDPNTYEQSFEYMFGDKYLVAPIYKPMSETNARKIYLPKHKGKWQHYFTKELFEAGQVIELENNFDTMPVFIYQK